MYSQATVSDTDPNDSPDTGLPCRRNVQSAPLSVLEYAKSNHLQRRYCQFVLDFCQLAFSTEPDQSQQFLDVGCGPGDFTRDVLLPRCLPCRRIVGVDCSRDMIEHARRNSAHEQLEFAVLDICSDVTGFLEEFGQFERVYSFFCLNWVEDISAALKNISRLMSSSGECLLVICAALQIIEVWNILAKMDRWAKYSKTLLKFIPKTQDMKDKRELMRYISGLLRQADLFPTIMEALSSTIFDGWSEEEIIAVYHGVCPISHLVTCEEKLVLDTFFRDQFRKLHAPEAGRGHYRILVVKASKAPC